MFCSSLTTDEPDSETPTVLADDQSVPQPTEGTDEGTVPEGSDAPPAETEQTSSGASINVLLTDTEISWETPLTDHAYLGLFLFILTAVFRSYAAFTCNQADG